MSYSKRQELIQSKKRPPEPLKYIKDPPVGYLGVFHIGFFSELRLFFKNFWIASQGPPFNFATEWMLKNPKGPPFYIFRHCDTVQKSNFFWGFLSPKAPPFIFFHILQQTGVSKSPKGPPF